MAKISLFVTTVLAYLAATAEGRAPIDPQVHRMLQQTGTANVFVTMKEKPDKIIDDANKKKFKTDTDKRKKVSDDLEVHAATSQRGARKLLAGNQGRFTRFESLWLTNQIFIEGASAELVNELSMLASVAKVEIEESLQMTKPGSTPIEHIQVQMMRNEDYYGDIIEASAVSDGTVTSGVNMIRAPRAWASGYNGAGVVVGSIDTGVRYTHSALRANYRGGSYSWYDPVKKTSLPYDDLGHGTHVMGTIVGSGGIGVAPGAKWIACKACDATSCSAYAVKACLQWMYCPTTYDGMNKDCSKAPRVVNNSWGKTSLSTDTVTETYFDVKALITANIVPIFSAGNNGPTCGSIMYPGGRDIFISAGALGTDNQIASFSSKGPNIYNFYVKPDVSAPGVKVLSAYNTSDTAYMMMSGTSMAVPHVTGVAALLFQQKPSATYDWIKYKLRSTANTALPLSAYTCGGISSNIFPNNIYGKGRVDAAGALGLP